MRVDKGKLLGLGVAVLLGALVGLGSFTFLYGEAGRPTVVQVHGEGPFDINYLNPADNPDKSAKQ